MLTAAQVSAAKPAEKPYKVADGGGMYLLVKPNGGRYWRLDYRYHGKRRTLALGVYPVVSLAEAREECRAAKDLLKKDIDPSHQRKLDKQTAMVAQANTFEAIAEEYLAKLARENRAEATLGKKRWFLSLAYPDIGDRPIAAITAPELLAVLRKVERRGRYETAHRLRSLCGEIFRYAIATARAERDPSADLRGALTAPQVRHHAAITDPADIGALLHAIDGYAGNAVTAHALKLAPLVFVRPGELRHAAWQEIDFEAALWTIPAQKMKMGRPHLVPLAAQALAILQDLHALTGRGGFLFPSLRSPLRPMSENTLNAALRRLGYSKDEMTAHGFRSMATVRLNEMGMWNPDAIERQLAHQEQNAVRRAYNSQAEYLEERRRMMQYWADYLDQLRQGAETPASVAPAA